MNWVALFSFPALLSNYVQSVELRVVKEHIVLFILLVGMVNIWDCCSAIHLDFIGTSLRWGGVPCYTFNIYIFFEMVFANPSHPFVCKNVVFHITRFHLCHWSIMG